MTAALVRRRVIVRGRVQGVFFRGSTQQEATRRGVHGWVRNLAGGDVEAVFEGEPDAVAELVAFAHEGPRHAQVREVLIHEEAPEGERGFRVAHGDPRGE